MADVATPTPNSDVDIDSEPVRQRRFTREEYVRMAETGVLGPEDRTELIDGYLVERTAQNAPHRAVIVNGTKLFVDLLRDTDYSVQIQSTLPLDCRNVPEPDFAIFQGEGSDLLDGEPDEIPLIVEVADTTLTYDRTDKLDCYASNDIPEYWSQPPEPYAGVLPRSRGRRVPRATHAGARGHRRAAIRRHTGVGCCGSASGPVERRGIEDRGSEAVRENRWELCTSLPERPDTKTSALQALRSCLADALWPATSWISCRTASALAR